MILTPDRMANLFPVDSVIVPISNDVVILLSIVSFNLICHCIFWGSICK